MRSHAAPWLLAVVCISCAPDSDTGAVLDPLLEAAASAQPAERCVNVTSDATPGWASWRPLPSSVAGSASAPCHFP